MNLQLVYRHYLSLSKMKICLKQQTKVRKQKKTKKKKNSKEKKKERKKKFPLVGIEPQTIDVWDHRYIYCATP